MKLIFGVVAALFLSAAVIGAFVRVAVNTYNGSGFGYLAASAIFCAIAWVAGKIENRNNKDSV